MGRNAVWSVTALAVAMMFPPALRAQVQTLKDFQVADVELLAAQEPR